MEHTVLKSLFKHFPRPDQGLFEEGSHRDLTNMPSLVTESKPKVNDHVEEQKVERTAWKCLWVTVNHNTAENIQKLVTQELSEFKTYQHLVFPKQIFRR